MDGRYCTPQVAIVTILPEERDAVRTFFDLQEDLWGLGYLVNDTSDPNVLLAQAERTQVGVTHPVTSLLADAAPEKVILTGIAGGIPGREDVLPGDVVVPDYVHYFHYTKRGPDEIEKRYLATDQPSSELRRRHARPVDWPDNHHEWIDRVQAPRPEFPFPPGREPRHESRAFEGSLVAADDLWGNPSDEDQRRLVRDYPDAVAVDMESMGVAKALFEYRTDVRYNPQFLIIRGISDLVLSKDKHDPEWIQQVGDNQSQRKAWGKYAAEAAASYTAGVVGRIMRRDDPRRLERRGR